MQADALGRSTIGFRKANFSKMFDHKNITYIGITVGASFLFNNLCCLMSNDVDEMRKKISGPLPLFLYSDALLRLCFHPMLSSDDGC